MWFVWDVVVFVGLFEIFFDLVWCYLYGGEGGIGYVGVFVFFVEY